MEKIRAQTSLLNKTLREILSDAIMTVKESMGELTEVRFVTYSYH